MINIGLLIVFAVAGAGLGVAYNFLVIKKFPEARRKRWYVLTVFVFFLAAAALFAIFSVRAFVDSTVKEKSLAIEEFINKNNPNNRFVRNGLDLTGIDDDISRLNNSVTEIGTLLPAHTELGIGRGLYNIILGLFTKELQKKLLAANASGKLANSFADENNFLTVSSTINGLRKYIMNIVNIIIWVFASIFIIIFVVHIIKSLVIVSKEKKKAGS